MTPNLPAKHERGRRSPAVPRKARGTFLEALGAGYSITHAAAAAGVHRRRFYELRNRDQGFADEWADAFESGTDLLRDELRRRALEGNEEPVVSAGKILGYVRKFDHRDIALELRRRDPAYRDRPDVAIAIAGVDAGPQKIQRGASLASVAKVLLDAGIDLEGLAAGADLAELEAGESAIEIVDVEDVPVEGGQ